jgi:diguanylate cyclase (GGDEF)-like protein
VHRGAPFLALVIAAAAAAFDARAVVVAAVAVVLAQLPALWRSGDRPTSRSWLVLVAAVILIAAGSSVGLRETTLGSAAWVLGAGLPLVAPVITTGGGRIHAAEIAGGLTLGAGAAGALAAAVLAGPLPGPILPPAVVVIALLVTVAHVAGAAAAAALDGGGRGERWIRGGAWLLAVHTALATAGADRPLPRLAVAFAAAGLVAWGVAASDPRPCTSGRRRARSAGPGSRLLPIAAGALLAPVVLALAAARSGAVSTVVVLAVCAPVVPAIAHLILLVLDRVSHAESAGYDALTGLPAETLLADRLGRALAAARRDGTQVAVAFFDLDGFKAVNDRHGHDVGDVLLREIARRLQAAVREGDTVARRSGDEFLLLLPRVAGRAGVEHVARRVAEAVRAPIEVGARRLEVGASVGLAMWPDDGLDEADLLRQADAAMYLAKAASSGERLRWCTDAATARSRVSARLRTELERATVTGHVHAATQEVLDLGHEEVVGHHVRPRWPHPRLGALTPSAFLPLLVDPDVARRLDQVLLELAIAAAGDGPEILTVPLTAASTTDDGLPRAVAGLLADHGRAPWSLRLAVHASGVRRGGAELQRVGARLEAIGVRLVVTGLGDESLSWHDLANLPLAALEIGADTVRSHDRPSSRAVMRGIVATGAAWNLEVGAAGVDDAAALEVVTAAGCSQARGREVTRAVAGGRRPRPSLTDAPRSLDGTVRALLGGVDDLPAHDLDVLLRQLELPA